MQQNQLKVEIRTSTGKGISRKLRAAGRVPGVIYGRGVDPVPVSLEPKALQAVISGEGGINNLISLDCAGELNNVVVIVADLQRDAIKRTLEHVDLQRVNMNEKIKVHVPIQVQGTAAGVKEGGMLDLDSHTLHLECLPTQIPEFIEIDVSSLQIGQTLHLQDVAAPEGVTFLGNPESPVASVLGRAKAVEVEEEETEEETEE